MLIIIITRARSRKQQIAKDGKRLTEWNKNGSYIHFFSLFKQTNSQTNKWWLALHLSAASPFLLLFMICSLEWCLFVRRVAQIILATAAELLLQGINMMPSITINLTAHWLQFFSAVASKLQMVCRCQHFGHWLTDWMDSGQFGKRASFSMWARTHKHTSSLLPLINAQTTHTQLHKQCLTDIVSADCALRPA